jgi:hypothetical protein
VVLVIVAAAGPLSGAVFFTTQESWDAAIAGREAQASMFAGINQRTNGCMPVDLHTTLCAAGETNGEWYDISSSPFGRSIHGSTDGGELAFTMRFSTLINAFAATGWVSGTGTLRVHLDFGGGAQETHVIPQSPGTFFWGFTSDDRAVREVRVTLVTLSDPFLGLNMSNPVYTLVPSPAGPAVLLGALLVGRRRR